jgi:hypothetical protein
MKKFAAIVATAVAVLGLAGVAAASEAPSQQVAAPCCKTVQ